MPRSARLAVGTALAALGLMVGAAAPAAAAPGDLDWFFTDAARTSPTTTFADVGNLYRGDFPLVCNPGGTGDLPGLWNAGTFTLRGTGVPNTFVRFGGGNDYPLCGDWDGDGVDTPGVVRGNVFHLASRNVTGGGTVTTFAFGSASHFPLVGDWDGNGTDTIAMGAGNLYFFASANTAGGGTVVSSAFGSTTDYPVAADFDGDGRDTLALQRDNQFFVSNDRAGTTMGSDRSFRFGRATFYPVAGTLAGRTGASIGVVAIPE